MYDVARLLPIFTSILGDFKEYSNYEYYFHCPFCNHYRPKLAVNLGKGKWHCWKCNSAGNRLVSLAKRLDVTPSQLKELREILVDEVAIPKRGDKSSAALLLPEEFQPLWKPSKQLEYKHALFYLKTRNITAYDILRYGMGYCSSGTYVNRIIIPSYDESGKLNYFVGRDFFETSHMKYKNPPVSKNVVGFDYHINWNYPIVLCEGVMDAMSIKWNAIPLFGKTLPPKLQQKIVEKHVREIYIALDADAMLEALKLTQTFVKEGQVVYLVEMGLKDPAEVGFAGMQQAIRSSHKMTFKDILAMKLS